MIKKYFREIQNLLDSRSHIIEDQVVNTKTYADDKGSITGEVSFIDESTLDFLEVVDTNKTYKDKYKYHYMDKDKQLVFRYDNAPHFKALKTFPHHKHTKNEVIESNEPNLEGILNEIESNLINT